MTNCIDNLSCLPTNSPLEVFHAFDAVYGNGMTLVVMALILGIIEVAIYMRTRSLVMLSVLGIYTIGAFAVMMASPLIASQYHTMLYVIALAATSGLVMAVLKVVREG